MAYVSRELFEEIVQRTAGNLHEAWCKERHYAPRPKPVSVIKDFKWILSHYKVVYVQNWKLVYDIANTKYEDLTRQWQLENEASARVATILIADELKFIGTSTDNINIEKACKTIHARWLDRNWEHAREDQKLPYHRLSEEEKEKDRVVIREAIRVWNEMAK